MADRTVKVGLIAEVGGYVAGMEKARKATSDMAQDSAQKLAQQREAFTTVGTAALAMGAIAAAGIAVAVKAFADFDQKMSNIQAATNETSANMGLLRNAALEAGRDTAFSAGEAADAITELAKAGVATTDILGGGLRGALDLAAAGEISVARAAEIAATALTQFKLEGRDVPRVADLLSSGANKAQGGVEDLSAALQQAGLVSAAAGLSIEETVGGLSAFASAGLLGSDAGTSFKSMLQRLTPVSAESKREMDRLGISAFDANGQFIGLSQFAGNLQESLKDLTPEQRAASQAIIFGTDAVRASNVLYEQGAAGIAKWVREVDDSGAAARTAQIKLDNLNGDLQLLSGSLNTALIEGGSGANDILRQLTQTATFLVNGFADLPRPVLDAGLAIGAVTAAMAIAGGGALVLVPKIAAARGALLALNITAGSAARSIATTGGAMAFATIAIGYFVTRAANAASTTTELRNSLDQTTGALTAYSRELVVTKLAESGAFDAAREAGIKQRDLTDAVMEGGAALDEVQAKLAGNNTIVTFFTGAGIAAGNASNTVRDLAGAVQNSQTQFEDADAAAEGNAEAIAEVDAAAAAADQAVDELSDTLRNFGQVQLDARSAAREFESAVDDATQSLVDNGATLDITTEAGRANQQALDDIAASSNALAAAKYDETGSLEIAAGALEAGRQKYIETGRAMGLTEQQAIDYANALIATPDTIRTNAVLSGVAEAERNLIDFITRSNGRRISIGVGTMLRPGDRIANANGNMHSYANGGVAPGIYKGGAPLYKFAEPETRWEAFVSGKPGQEARNRGVVMQAAERLGMVGPSYVGASAARQAPQVNVTVSSKGGIDLLKYVDVQAQQTVQGSMDSMYLDVIGGATA